MTAFSRPGLGGAIASGLIFGGEWAMRRAQAGNAGMWRGRLGWARMLRVTTGTQDRVVTRSVGHLNGRFSFLDEMLTLRFFSNFNACFPFFSQNLVQNDVDFAISFY